MPVSIRYFVSYAHGDAADAQRLRGLLRPLFATSAKFEFSGWTDHLILPGEHWREEIEKALAKADFGLLLLSPNFFASKFIIEDELTALLEKSRVVPVMLKRVLLDGTMELRGLQDREIFLGSRGRAFKECHGADRDAFALELFRKITALLEKVPC